MDCKSIQKDLRELEKQWFQDVNTMILSLMYDVVIHVTILLCIIHDEITIYS